MPLTIVNTAVVALMLSQRRDGDDCERGVGLQAVKRDPDVLPHVRASGRRSGRTEILRYPGYFQRPPFFRRTVRRRLSP
jgi:hypothetical protein